jgi:DNA-binding transcriptional ArsR family regulator
MNREHLAVLRGAIDTILDWPDSVRDQIAQWLAPAKPNGHDPHPPNGKDLPPIASLSPRSTPHAGKTRHGRSPADTDERLLAALRDTPGLSAVKLAAAVRTNRSTVGDRLRELAGRELVEKDDDGRWRVVEEKARPARVEPRPSSPSL